MSRISLDDFDKHIANLRAQLQFLNHALEATDHNAPDWVSTDILALRNKTGRLNDDMARFKEQLESEGMGQRSVKTSNKRLSIESAREESPRENKKGRIDALSARESTPASQPPTSPPQAQSANLPSDSSPQPNPAYQIQRIDVSEEVNRRLHQNRLRRLMDSPATSQKRKYDVFEDVKMDSASGTEGVDDDKEEVLERGGRNGVKRVRSSGTFGGLVGTIEGVLKRKDGGEGGGQDEGGSRSIFKRRRV